MAEENKLKVFEVVVLSLTLFFVISTIFHLCVDISPEIIRLLNIFETISCFIFVTEWFIRFNKSKDKKKFTLWNIFDLLGSVPIYLLPGAAVLKITRLIKLVGSFTRLGSYYNKQKNSVLQSLFFIIFIVILLLGSILILYFEQGADGSIKTAEDALWWMYITMSTIGYGDLYPVTTGGRIVTVFISLGGISLFGIISTIVINHTLNEKNKN